MKAIVVRRGESGPASGALVFQHKSNGWASAEFLSAAWYGSLGVNSARAIAILQSHAFADNPLTYKGPRPIDFCLQGTLPLFFADGAIPM